MGAPGVGPWLLTPCPSEAAYRRELRGGGPIHPQCREAANRAHQARRDAARAAAAAAGCPYGCPPVLPDLEATLAYPCGYAQGPAGWEHE